MNAFRQLLIRSLRTVGLYHPLRDWRRDRRFRQQGRSAIAAWHRQGCPSPPPDLFKYECIRSHARLHSTPVLVETGTWFGNALFFLRRDFREIHSIELAAGLHDDAARQLAHLPHIRLHLGDSTVELPKIARTLSRPALYWLDGHYCEGPSARGAKETPIVEELTFLLARPPGRDVVLIDDARYFTGANGYPTIGELRRLVAAARPAAGFELEHDIVRIFPV